MAGLLDMLLGRGEYMDPNKVLDRRMAEAGIPNQPRLVAGQVPQPQGQVPGNSDAFSQNVMNEIRRRRQARAQAQAAEQNGGRQLF